VLTVTFETMTPESAEQGDAESRGYAHPNGGNDETIENVKDYAWRLSTIVHRFGVKSCENAGRWFDVLDSDENYRTGAETRYSIHPPRNVSDASYARLSRILNFRDVS
jgi:hypothetical protein